MPAAVGVPLLVRLGRVELRANVAGINDMFAE